MARNSRHRPVENRPVKMRLATLHSDARVSSNNLNKKGRGTIPAHSTVDARLCASAGIQTYLQNGQWQMGQFAAILAKLGQTLANIPSKATAIPGNTFRMASSFGELDFG